MERTIAAMDPDYWPYGFAANRAKLDAVCRNFIEQHLAARRVSLEDLFHLLVPET